MASSKVHPGEIIFNDETPLETIEKMFKPYSRGLKKGFASQYGNRPAGAIPKDWLVDMSDKSAIQAMIQEIHDRGLLLSDRIKRNKIPPKNQQSTNLCWANAPVMCVQLNRMAAGMPHVELSPASVACPITGFNNVGGWGTQAMQRIISDGIVPSALWPDNAIRREYYTAANREVAMDYRVTEWVEGRPSYPGNEQDILSTLLRLLAGAAGIDAWSHEVSFVDPLWLDGWVAWRIYNSWGLLWGDKGFGIIQGRKWLPSDYVVPLVTTAA